ncbi:MAG: hypothetical protein ACP5PW_05765 [Candidatus Dormibacteria bacterium]
MPRSSPPTTGLVPAREVFLGQASAILLVTAAGVAVAALLWSGPLGPAYVVLWGVGGVGLGAGVGAVSSRGHARRIRQGAGLGPPSPEMSPYPARVSLETGIWFAAIYAALVGAALLMHFGGALTVLVLTGALAVAGGQQLGLFWWTAREELSSGGKLLVQLRRGRLGLWGIDLLQVAGAPWRDGAPGHPGSAA